MASISRAVMTWKPTRLLSWASLAIWMSTSTVARRTIEPRSRPESPCPVWWMMTTLQPSSSRRYRTAAQKAVMSIVVFSSPPPKYTLSVSVTTISGANSRSCSTTSVTRSGRESATGRIRKRPGCVSESWCSSHAFRRTRSPFTPSPARYATRSGRVTLQPNQSIPWAACMVRSHTQKLLPSLGGPKATTSALAGITRPTYVDTSGRWTNSSRVRNFRGSPASAAPFPFRGFSASIFACALARRSPSRMQETPCLEEPSGGLSEAHALAFGERRVQRLFGEQRRDRHLVAEKLEQFAIRESAADRRPMMREEFVKQIAEVESKCLQDQLCLTTAETVKQHPAILRFANAQAWGFVLVRRTLCDPAAWRRLFYNRETLEYRGRVHALNSAAARRLRWTSYSVSTACAVRLSEGRALPFLSVYMPTFNSPAIATLSPSASASNAVMTVSLNPMTLTKRDSPLAMDVRSLAVTKMRPALLARF